MFTKHAFILVVWFSRVWCAGVIHLPVKTEAHVGSKVLPSRASVPVAGLASTVMCPASAVRSPLSSKVTQRENLFVRCICICVLSQY